jgi:peptidoglycan/LPS O-acetylase OafA/YrhL
MTRNLSVSLESVRGLAALVVLLAHAMQWFVRPPAGKASPVVAVTQHAAHFAVLVFFALSGYVICFSMSRHAAKNGALDETAFLKALIHPVLSAACAGVIPFCHVVARYFEDRARWSRLMGWETRSP